MTLDVEVLRKATPGTAEVIHLNNAGAALMPLPVIDAIHGYLDTEIHIGGYEASIAFAAEIEAAYASIAAFIGADPHEIALEDSSTRAWDIAFYGVPLDEGDSILTTTTEYWSNLGAYLHLRDTRGVDVRIVPDTPEGDIDLEELDSMVDGTVGLISINHVPTNSGLVNPAARVGSIARSHGVPFLLDACQSVGQVPVDVDEIGCDLLTATSRKWLRGPRGVGFLYVRDEFRDRLRHPMVQVLDGREVHPDRIDPRRDARRFETWEKNHALPLGLGAAVDYASELGIDEISRRIAMLGDIARRHLGGLPRVEIRDRGSVLGGIVTFTVDGHDPFAIREALREQRINVSVPTSHSSPIDMASRDLPSMIRASFHAYNTEDEIAALVGALRGIVDR